MEREITENDYPVESKWLLKTPLNFLISIIIIAVFISLFFIPLSLSMSEGWIIFIFVIGTIFLIMTGFTILSLILAALSRDNFHYSLESEFMIFRQGILTKQQKNLPYGVIQDLIVGQDITDRLLGIASLSIENASFGGGQVYSRGGRTAGAWIGFVGNTATIPGLTRENAETLKNILLAKIKQYGGVNTRSGL